MEQSCNECANGLAGVILCKSIFPISKKVLKVKIDLPSTTHDKFHNKIWNQNAICALIMSWLYLTLLSLLDPLVISSDTIEKVNKSQQGVQDKEYEELAGIGAQGTSKEYEELPGMGAQGTSKADFVGTIRINKGDMKKGGTNLEVENESVGEPVQWRKRKNRKL